MTAAARAGKGCLSLLGLQRLPEEVLKDRLLATAPSAAHPQGLHTADMLSRVPHVALRRVAR